ncbi:TPA: Crp/Fnr family transcriptional regulator [Enterobacter asburiae]|uniref:helix-turn-helix domain-containing protein n=1 Tax=Enterobacter asburiae TaxID=61645 RepID=UPI000665D43D|nr:helix-turn-helix domain-containing protein [Enterobacter asburiae]MEA1020255.1 helix-turn-helix domain-containing protein [Enterobacter asburiae]HAS1950869.1 Crp/Fnr family transcriptional regulator [Enterobacter asburiae]HAS1953093.1 Crp/Fnr family transcriptional regulator [Enterobacter asburiae]HAS1955790.1 Crp/Fnr family transcriptional regulator [Enterobacter asburiae]HAS1957996.1 Crp/Fnr family transcriptional regulator [Enterobacter asburiae]
MKPETHFNALIQAASDTRRIQSAKPRQLISLENKTEPVTFILHEGVVAIYRSSDRLLIKYIRAPMITGMNELIDTNADIFIKAYRNVSYEILPTKEMLDVISTQGLWKEAAYCYMYAVRQLLVAHYSSVGLSTYELIRLNLIALMNEDEALSAHVNVSDYILEKTRLSRSRVMKILGDLRIGGYIEINRGILIKINKLPEKY